MYETTPDPNVYPLSTDLSIIAELLKSCISAVYGKTKQLDDLYLIRQGHDTRYLLPTWFDWITSETW